MATSISWDSGSYLSYTQSGQYITLVLNGDAHWVDASGGSDISYRLYLDNEYKYSLSNKQTTLVSYQIQDSWLPISVNVKVIAHGMYYGVEYDSTAITATVTFQKCIQWASGAYLSGSVVKIDNKDYVHVVLHGNAELTSVGAGTIDYGSQYNPPEYYWEVQPSWYDHLVGFSVNAWAYNGSHYDQTASPLTVSVFISSSHYVKYHDGTAWQKCTIHYCDGTNWIECIPMYYDGTSWVECSS